MFFSLWKALGYLGFFRYDGLFGFEPTWWPRARVLYPPTEDRGPGYPSPYPAMLSAQMAIGNAWSYARIFNGKVVPVDFKLEKPS